MSVLYAPDGPLEWDEAPEATTSTPLIPIAMLAVTALTALALLATAIREHPGHQAGAVSYTHLTLPTN